MPLMRDEIWAALDAGVPAVNHRIWQEGMADPQEGYPFLVLEMGAQDAGNPWLAYGEPVTVTVHGDETTFETVDVVEEQVKAALTNLVVLDDEAGANVRYILLYVGNASPDDVEERRPGRSLVRAVQFVAFSLALLDARTYEPDPVTALQGWVRERFSELQGVTITGHPTGGTWTLQYPAGGVTAPIPYNASALQVQAALEALPQIGVGGVVVTGGGGVVGVNGGPYTVRFAGAQAAKDHGPLVANAAGLTLPAPPVSGITVVTLREGAAVQLDPATWSPTNNAPIVYWRFERYLSGERTNAHTRRRCLYRGHVIVSDYGKRLEWIRRICEAVQEDDQAPMTDGAPLHFEHVEADSRLHPVTEGQIGLRVWWDAVPEVREAVSRLNTAILTGVRADDDGPLFTITVTPAMAP